MKSEGQNQKPEGSPNAQIFKGVKFGMSGLALLSGFGFRLSAEASAQAEVSGFRLWLP
jgi:hypothetical protein